MFKDSMTRHRHVLALGLILLSAYSLVYQGRYLGSGDEITRFLMAENLSQGRGFRSEYVDLNGVRHVYGGQVAPKFGFLHPLLAAPLRLLSFVEDSPALMDKNDIVMLYEVPAHRRAPAFVLWFNPLVAVGLALAFFGVGRRLAFSERCCFATSLLLGLCTMVFAYTPVFFTEILTAFLLTSAYGAALSDRRRDIVLCGFWAGLLACNNALFLLCAPVFLCDLFSRRRVTDGWRGLGLFALGITPGLIFFFIQVGSRGGLGYAQEPGFSTPLAVGLFGNLLSPGKSIFVFSPVVILGLVGFRRLWLVAPRAALLAVALAVPLLLLYSKWWNWAGGTCWGPRFLLPLLPLTMVGALPVIASWAKHGPIFKTIILALALVGFLVQLSATVVPPYAWFHDASRSLSIQMRDNRFSGEGVDASLALFETSLPLFPRYFPPYLQAKAFMKGVRTGRPTEFFPMWIRKRLFWAPVLPLVVIIACSFPIWRRRSGEST
jgi:hypothetical protein